MSGPDARMLRDQPHPGTRHSGPPGPTATRVGIGLIRKGDSYLIRPRPPGSPMPGVWEFPGGKCEPGEDPRDAAVRECFEETGLEVRAVAARRVVLQCYPHGLVELSYFDCRPVAPDAEPDPHSGFRWVLAGDLSGYTFPPANGPILADLAREFGPPAGGRLDP